MAKLFRLFFFLLCLIGLLFDYQGATCSSPSPSPSASPPSLSSSDDNHLLCSHSEKTALLQFKSLFGEDPPALITWKDEACSDCRLWSRVTCDNLTGHVIKLDLTNSQLHEAIPSNSTRFHLSHLRELYFSNNDFNGSSIFPAFGRSFPHLTHLVLTSSNFAGPISSSEMSHKWLSNLTELAMLDLSNNKLTGPIPITISGLHNLVELNLDKNLLSGTLPPNLFDLPMLAYMDLSFNQLSGAIPTTKWASNSPLIHLRLNDNQLQGSIPGSIARLSNLTELILSNNNLSGTLRPQLFLSFRYMDVIDLSHNSFQGPLPRLPSTMKFFFVSHNKLEGDIPLSYCDLRILYNLVLSHYNLSGVIPECITNSSPYLLVLDLGMNAFHGKIPDNFSEGNKLESFNLKGNLLEGKLPSSLANCKNLTVLDIGNNRIKDTFPYWLQSLPNLEVLVLCHNKFHGSLGGLIARTKGMVTPFFPKLRIFDLSHNKFSGPLPSSYFHRLSE